MKEFQIRSFAPEEKWSPPVVEFVRSEAMISVKEVVVSVRVLLYWVGLYIFFRMKIPGPWWRMWCHSFWREFVVDVSAWFRVVVS